ncbi:MAG TPA: sigma-70 family RNA polymerase sigma factor [Gemmata sp.]|nr:sigma-70 family RNA polymerase sigma factor [Gemmata sp.]
MSNTTVDTRPTLLARLLDPQPDPSSWAEFVKCYRDQIHNWCRAWGLQDTDAEDVTQSVLVRLLRKLRRFRYDPARSFRGWLRTVTYNVVQDWRAEAAAGPKASGDSKVFRLLASSAARDDLASRIEAEYARELLNVAMLRVRQRVQPHTWASFYQTAVEDRDPGEVAAELEISVANLFVYRSRVRKLLSEELERIAPAAPTDE